MPIFHIIFNIYIVSLYFLENDGRSTETGFRRSFTGGRTGLSASRMEEKISSLPFGDRSENAVDLQRYCSSQYPLFKKDEFYDYLINFKLDKKQKLVTYFDGMKKQLSFICGICLGAEYLFLDETLDGLDAVTRQ